MAMFWFGFLTTLLAINVYLAASTGNPISWAAVSFIGSCLLLVVHGRPRSW